MASRGDSRISRPNGHPCVPLHGVCVFGITLAISGEPRPKHDNDPTTAEEPDKEKTAQPPLQQEASQVPCESTEGLDSRCSVKDFITKALHLAVAASGQAQMPVQDVDKLMPKLAMTQYAERIMEVKTPAELDAQKMEWLVHNRMASQLKDGLGKAAQKLGSHVDSMAKKIRQNEIKSARQKASDAMQGQKTQGEGGCDEDPARQQQAPANHGDWRC